MTLVQLLLTRRYSIREDEFTAYLTFIQVGMERDAFAPPRLFSRRRNIEKLVEILNDNHPTA